MRRPAGAATALVFAATLPLAAVAQVGTAPPSRAEAVIDELERAWQAGDVAAYLALWRFDGDEGRRVEVEYLEGHLQAGSSQLRVHRPAMLPDAARLRFTAEVATVEEPRGRVESLSLVLERGPEGYRLVERELLGALDGLFHLSLDPAGYRAAGLSLRLEDFTLEMGEGTLFTSPPELGPTALVFVGKGRVRFEPRPQTEREQLKQFAGRPALDEKVEQVFARLHPADLHRLLSPVRLDRDPEAPRRYGAARRLFDAHAGQTFVLEAPVPGSPWWVLPSPGDAAVTFESKRGTLTFAVTQSDPESLSLFDRGRRRQICLYPSEGRAIHYSEDAGRSYDILSHDISLRFDPGRDWLEGEDRLRLKLLGPVPSLTLRLDESLVVSSVSSQAGRHLFFRVRNQDSLLVALGGLTGEPEIELTVEYAGRLAATKLESEVLQIFPGAAPDDLVIERVHVYTNRQAWYPQGFRDDFALARLRLELPEREFALTGGERVGLIRTEDRTLVEYELEQPGKYMSLAIGRLEEVTRTERPVPIRAFAVPRTAGAAREATELASDILAFFSERFGPIPYEPLALAVIEGTTPGGHSPPGMVLMQERPVLLREPLRDDPASFHDVTGFFLAHELAHQWWGHGVAGENYHERWLSEATAHYAAALWTRRHHGEERFQDVLKRMARWAWDENEAGPISLGYRLGHVRGDPQVFRAVVYDKGAYVLHMLHRLVGETAFRQGLARFQSEFRFRKAGTHDLRRALERASGRDLAAYFESWVYGTRLPELRWSSTTSARPGGGYRTLLRVEARDLPGPVPLTVELRFRRGRERREVLVEPGANRFMLDSEERPRKLEPNADRGLLAKLEKR